MTGSICSTRRSCGQADLRCKSKLACPTRKDAVKFSPFTQKKCAQRASLPTTSTSPTSPPKRKISPAPKLKASSNQRPRTRSRGASTSKTWPKLSAPRICSWRRPTLSTRCKKSTPRLASKKMSWRLLQGRHIQLQRRLGRIWNAHELVAQVKTSDRTPPSVLLSGPQDAAKRRLQRLWEPPADFFVVISADTLIGWAKRPSALLSTTYSTTRTNRPCP